MHGLPDATLARVDLAECPDFALGGVSVSPSTRTVRGPGGETSVEPRVMQVLVTLAGSAGRVLSRDALFRRCWGGVFVGEDSLNRVIREIRRIGRTVAAGGFAVETIPRTGYRLVTDTPVAEVTPKLVADVEPAASEPQSEPAKASGPSRRLVVGAGLLAAAGGGVGLWLTRPDPRVAALIAQSEQAQRNGLPDSDGQGVGFLEEAVRLEPGDARAWGKLALCRCVIAEHTPPDRVSAAATATQDAARRALAIDRRQIDAHAALALLPPYYGDWLAAERRMDAVLAIDPEHLPTRDAQSFLRVAVGRGRESCLDRITFAGREPLHATHQYRLVYANWFLGRIDAADRAADRALQLWPKHPGVWFVRLWTLAFTGRAERALAHVDDAAARPALPPPMIRMLKAAMTALASRRPADVAQAADAMTGLVSQGPSHSVHAIMILNALGEVGRAFDVAHAYLLEQGPLMASVRWRAGQVSINDHRRRKTNPLFVPVSAPMRADGRFAALVERIGLVDYWRRVGVTPDYLRAG